MRRLLISCVFALFAAKPALSQQPAGGCGREGVNRDSLTAQARRLHPDVTKAENQSDFVIVALVYDNHCAIVRHGMKRVARNGDVEKIMADVFPDSTKLTVESFEISGFASLGATSRDEVKNRPVVAWGILTPRGMPRRP